ncbi:MAG TPA: hypothetical protein VJZ27_14550, partial [Aggregatilineales bacterium]|nr:hypothetical protein [Aggregatilineales bacterium]
MRSIRILIMCLVLVTLLLPLGAMASQPGDETVDTIGANPMPPRDPVDLAIRFQGLDPAVIDFAPRPAYQVGDFETFSIGGSDGTEVRSVDMVLAASADNVYLWFERGLAYDENDV